MINIKFIISNGKINKTLTHKMRSRSLSNARIIQINFDEMIMIELP